MKDKNNKSLLVEKEERIDNLKISFDSDYKIKTVDKAWKEKDKPEYVYLEQKDVVEIDRKKETINHYWQFAAGVKFKNEFYVEEGVGVLLDVILEESNNNEIFSKLKKPSKTIRKDGVQEVKKYEIEVKYKNKGKKVLKGNFEKDGLPVDFYKVILRIADFVNDYGHGDILNYGI